MGERSELRVAAMHGWDLTHTPEEWNPSRLIGEGYELLALDRPAAARLLEEGHPFRTIEEWLHAHGHELTDMLERSGALLERWLAGRGDLLRLGGVDWPGLDHWQVPNLWLSATALVGLADAMRSAGVLRLRIAIGHGYDPTAPGLHPDAIVADVLQLLLPGIVEPVRVPTGTVRQRSRMLVSATPVGAVLRAVRRWRDAAKFRRAEREVLSRPRSLPLALLMLPKRELERSRPIIDALRDAGVVDMTVVPWMASTALTAEAAALHDLPWLPTPPLERGTLADERRFRDEIARSLMKVDLEELAPVQEALVAGLSRMSRRWAAEAGRLRWTRAMLRRVEPALVVAGRDDLSYQTPIEAADCLDIPVMTLPHGVVEWWPPARFAQPRNAVHLGGVSNPTAPFGAVRLCTDAFIEYEYPHRVAAVDSLMSASPHRSVLIITEGYNLGSCSELRAQREALHALVDAVASADVAARVLLKTHPGDLEDEQFLLPSGASCTVVPLPRSADLLQLLTASDLVVSVNNIGSALIHAVRSGAPVIRLSTRALLAAKGRTWLNWTSWEEFWSRELLTLRKLETLNETVSRSLSDPGFRAALRHRSGAAAAALAPDSSSPNIGSIVRELLERS